MNSPAPEPLDDDFSLEPESGIPRLRMAGDADRDARDVPYSFGNRKARLAANAKINKAAKGLRRKVNRLKAEHGR